MPLDRQHDDLGAGRFDEELESHVQIAMSIVGSGQEGDGK